MKFTKMHGAGNDYVYVDCFAQREPANPAELARLISDRHFGVGGDGLVLIGPSQLADARMRMFNADGSEAEMCGNAIRCVAKYVYDHSIARKTTLAIETGRGVLSLELEIEKGECQRARVDLGEPILEAAFIPTQLAGNPPLNAVLSVGGKELLVTCVSMGNPHCVCFVEQASDDWVLGLGPQIEHHPLFPRRTNVEFVEVLSRSQVRQRTWERGSGETLACGTGAAAVCVAGVLTGRTERKITVNLRGGDLQLEWNSANNHVFKTGPATVVFSGEWPD